MRGDYGCYLFQSQYLIDTITRLKGGMGVPHLFQEDLNKFVLPLPPLAEQRAIAGFLDREVAKLDALVAEQRRLIALLAEKRQAVISHAVTRGLDPSAHLKPSGIDWLGDIPEGWDVKKLKYLVFYA
jgi:type I restriction enzyme S subunit